MEYNIDLSNIDTLINPSFFPLLKDKNRYIVLKGGAGSGKSVFCGQKLLIRIIVGMDTGVIHNILCIRKTQPALRKSVFELFKGLLSEWGLLHEDFVKTNVTDMTFKFKNGSQIMCVGLDDSEKLKSIYGITSVWIEEASELLIADFRQINLRLRGGFNSYKQIMISFNPISKLIWVYDEFFEKKKVNATIHESTYKDNLYLLQHDPEYVEELERYKEIDPVYYNIYTLGEWGQILERIYSNYEIIENFPEEESFKEGCYSLDYGFNSPTAILFNGCHDDEFYIKQLLYEKKLTHNDIIGWFGKFIPLKKRRERIIYVDSAEAELIKELNSCGFIAKKSDKSVKEGINYCKRKKLYIDNNSVDLCKEIEAYSYRKDNSDNVIDEPIKINDHCMDAMRYALFTHWGKIRPKASLVFI